jgi:hypothetical protein
LTAVFALVVGIVLANPGAAQPQPQPRAHVHLLRGLMNIFSLGMDTLAEQLKRRGVNATVHNYAEWQTLADRAAADYKAGKEAPIILIGHSLGADAVMEMAAYLGGKGVPVALVVPFDGTKSFAASDNVARVLNLSSGTMLICEADLVSTARSPMSMSVPIKVSTTSISINHRGCMLASLPRFLLSSANTTSSKGCRPPHLRRPLLPKMVRNRFTPTKYLIDTRRIDTLSAVFWKSDSLSIIMSEQTVVVTAKDWSR